MIILSMQTICIKTMELEKHELCYVVCRLAENGESVVNAMQYQTTGQ